MTTHRYFAADESTYESVRTALNVAWGLPNNLGTVTCIHPAAFSPRLQDGRVVVAILPEWCEWEPAATMLPQLLTTSAVEEISREQYMTAMDET